MRKHDTDMIRIAVYGTLRRGGSANGHLRGAKYVGPDKIKAKLYRLGWFPGIRLDEHTTQEVVVDVYEVSKPILDFCDKYEGYTPGHPDQSLFVRKSIKTLGGLEVEVYEFNSDVTEDKRILSGDWFDEASRLPLSA